MRLDTKELQNEVKKKWKRDGVRMYFVSSRQMKKLYKAILNDPELMVKQLGFDSIASYIGSKRVKNDIGVRLSYVKLGDRRYKFTYEAYNQELDFYLDLHQTLKRATLWLRPGTTEALQEFIHALEMEAQHNYN